jgi:capsular exopolysaccharide synthesis family protein
MASTAPNPTSISLPADARALWSLLREKAWLVAVCVLLCGAFGFIYVLRTPKLYRATTTLQVDPEQQRVGELTERKSEEAMKEEVLKTIEQNLLSPALTLALVRSSELTSDAAFLPRIARPAADEQLRLALQGEIAVGVRRGTRLIDVTVEDENPAIAQKLSRLLVEEFFRSNAQSRASIALEAHRYLQDEADRLNERLTVAELQLQQYKEEHRAVSLDEKQNIVVERLKELNGKVTAAKAERLRLETDRSQIHAMRDKPPENLLALPSIAAAPEVEHLRTKIREKELEIGALGYKPEHPVYLKASGELAELKSALRDAIAKAAQRINAAIEAAQIIESKLEDALRTQEQQALELSKVAIPYEALEREVASDRALYQTLLTRAKEAAIAQEITRQVRVVTPALLPARPSRPNKKLIVLLSGCAGLAIGLSLALAAGLLDSAIKTVDQAEDVLRLRSLGAIPKSRSAKLEEARLLLVDRPQSAIAETFRALRTALHFAAPQDGFATVLFTSAVPGEGKSFCAISYAVALAQQGDRTLLIDADLRQPSIGRVFLGDETVPGVTDLLLGMCAVDQAVKLTSVKNLSVLPAGRILPNPGEILARAPFSQLLQTVLTRFDRVVIDTAPVQAVSETLLLAAQVQAVCLVVRSGKTGSNVAARALLRLREAHAHVAGFVLNAVPTANSGYYYHYHAQGYGGDEVYGGVRSRASKRLL